MEYFDIYVLVILLRLAYLVRIAVGSTHDRRYLGTYVLGRYVKGQPFSRLPRQVSSTIQQKWRKGNRAQLEKLLLVGCIHSDTACDRSHRKCTCRTCYLGGHELDITTPTSESCSQLIYLLHYHEADEYLIIPSTLSDNRETNPPRLSKT